MRPRLRGAVACIAGALFAFSQAAGSYTQQVTSNLWAESYAIPTPDGGRIHRRRLVEDLRLGAWNLLPGSDNPYYRGPRLSIEAALRLDTDFAIGQNECNPNAIGSYVPGVSPVALDAMVAYIDARGLGQDTLDLRAGRQIRIDTNGFFAFDGLEARLHLPIGIGLDTFVGYEVRGGDILGYDSLELDGTDNGGRHRIERDRYPDRTDPSPRLVVGTELLIMPRDWLEGAFALRAVGITGAPADERLGARLALGKSPFRAEGRIVWSALLEILTEVEADIAITPRDPVTLYLEYQLYRPIFEADSIFNLFDLAPQNDLGARVEARLAPGLTGAVWGSARLAEDSAGIEGDRTGAWISGGGGGIGANHLTATREISARFTWMMEWGESRYGAEFGVRHGVLPGERLWLGYRVSAWHVDDAFSSRLTGNILGYVISARFRIAEGAHLLGEFEHYAGKSDPHFVGLAMLQLDFWR